MPAARRSAGSDRGPRPVALRGAAGSHCFCPRRAGGRFEVAAWHSARLDPDFAEERILWSRGYRHVAGIDEVGRGCLAGPVTAAAVILPPNWKPARPA